MKNKFLSFVSRIFGGQKAISNNNPLSAFNGLNVDYSYTGINTILYADRKEKYVREGYAGNDIIYSIIRMILNKVKVALWGWYTIEDEKAYADYISRIKSMATRNYDVYGDGAATQIHKDFKEAMSLRSKAIKPLKGGDIRTGRLKELIEYPNSEQSWNELVEEGCGFKLITGDKFKVAEVSGAPLTAGLPIEINNLASQHMKIIRKTETFPYKAGAYQYQCGVVANYTREEMMHEKYFNPQWDAAGTHLYGFSPVQAAWLRLSRTKKGQIAAISAYDNGGSDGAMWPKDKEFAEFLATLKPDTLDETKQRVKSAIGGGAYKNGDIAVLGSGPWEYNRFRMSVVDLAIIEAEKWDMPMLCNCWQLPSQLMNDPANKIQANAVSGEKALTLRCALPLLVDERDSLNRKFQTDWGLKGKRIVIDFDTTVFTELEEDKKSQIEWLDKAWYLTPNQRLQVIGEPISDDPNMNRIWMPSNLIPMDDASVERIDPNTFINE